MSNADEIKDITMKILEPIINDEDKPDGILEIFGAIMSLGIIAGRYAERKRYPHPSNFAESIALMVKAMDDLKNEGTRDELMPMLQQMNAGIIAMGEEPLDLDFLNEGEAGDE